VGTTRFQTWAAEVCPARGDPRAAEVPREPAPPRGGDALPGHGQVNDPLWVPKAKWWNAQLVQVARQLSPWAGVTTARVGGIVLCSGRSARR